MNAASPNPATGHDVGSKPAGRARNRMIAAGSCAAVVIALAFVIALRPSPSSSQADTPAVELGVPASKPPLRGSAIEGKPLPTQDLDGFGGPGFRFGDLRGRPVVINFFSSTCVPCNTEMPELERAHRDLGDSVAFVGVDVLDSVESGNAMVERTRITWRLTRDPRGDLLTALGGVGLPTTLVADSEGTIRSVHIGQIDGSALRELLAGVGIGETHK